MPITQYLLDHAMNRSQLEDQNWMQELIDIAMKNNPNNLTGPPGVYPTDIYPGGSLTPTEASMSIGANDKDLMLQALAEQPMIMQRDAEEAKARTEREQKLTDAETAQRRAIQGAGLEYGLKAATATTKDKLGNEIARPMDQVLGEIDKVMARFGGGGATATDLSTDGYAGGGSGEITSKGVTKVLDPTTGQWVVKGATAPPKTKSYRKGGAIAAPEHETGLVGSLPEGSMAQGLAKGVATTFSDTPSAPAKAGLDYLGDTLGSTIPGVKAAQVLSKRKNIGEVTAEDVVKSLLYGSPLGMPLEILSKGREKVVENNRTWENWNMKPEEKQKLMALVETLAPWLKK